MTSRWYITPLLASSLLVGGVISGCSSGGSETLPTTTRVTLSPEEKQKASVCAFFVAYIGSEVKPVKPQNKDEEAAFAERAERSRIESLDRLRSVVPDSASAVREALAALRPMKPTDAPSEANANRSKLLKTITDYYDPTCETVAGQDPSRSSSTTLRLRAATSAVPGAPTSAGATPSAPAASGASTTAAPANPATPTSAGTPPASTSTTAR